MPRDGRCDGRGLCPVAQEALTLGALRWDGNDYIQPALPRRKNGDCLTFADCPYCGGELPPPEAQADGA
jgi:hypothetical protein